MGSVDATLLLPPMNAPPRQTAVPPCTTPLLSKAVGTQYPMGRQQPTWMSASVSATAFQTIPLARCTWVARHASTPFSSSRRVFLASTSASAA